MSAIYDLKMWKEIARRSTSGDQVWDILASWESNEAALTARNAELEEAIREFLLIEGTKDYSSGYDVMYDMGISLLKKVIGKTPESKNEK